MQAQRPDVVLCMTDPPIVGDIALHRRAPLPHAARRRSARTSFPEIAVQLGRLENPSARRSSPGAHPLLRAARRPRRRDRRDDARAARWQGCASRADRRDPELGRHDEGDVPRRRTTSGRASTDSPTASSSCTPATSGTRRTSTRSFAPRRSCAISTICGRDRRRRRAPRRARRARRPARGGRRAVPAVPAARPALARRSPRPTSTSSASARGLAGYVVPSRLYGILAAGRPVLVAAEAESETAQLVARVGCGIVVPPGPAGASWRRRYALRTTASTTSTRWAGAGASTSSPRRIDASPSGGTSDSCSSSSMARRRRWFAVAVAACSCSSPLVAVGRWERAVGSHRRWRVWSVSALRSGRSATRRASSATACCPGSTASSTAESANPYALELCVDRRGPGRARRSTAAAQRVFYSLQSEPRCLDVRVDRADGRAPAAEDGSVSQLIAVVVIFWVSLGALVWTHAAYPLAAALLARVRTRPVRKGDALPTVTLIVAAHNEEASSSGAWRTSARSTYPADKLEIVVTSDASTDATEELAAPRRRARGDESARRQGRGTEPRRARDVVGRRRVHGRELDVGARTRCASSCARSPTPTSRTCADASTCRPTTAGTRRGCTGGTSSACGRRSRGSTRSRAGTARSTRCDGRTTSRSTPASGTTCRCRT